MDLNKQGPSRRHISSSSTSTASVCPMFSESYYTVYSDDFGSLPSQQISSQPPLRQTPSMSYQQQQSQFNMNTPFFTPINPNDNFDIPTPPARGFLGPSQSTAPPQTFENQQFLMAAGQQLLSNPMTAAAIDAYSQSLMDKSKGWMGNIKQYFAIDTNYAVKKLLLIFLPFLHKDWSIRYNSESVAPRDEPNLPDLYIPSMAFVTYILISGYILGLRNQFAPEQLGIYASSALAWLLLEVCLIMIAKYLLNLSSALGFFHMIAFGGYKFVCIDTLLLVSIMLGRNSYLIFFIYTSLSLGYFLLRALSTNLQQSSYQQYDHNPRTAYYLVIFIALLQPLIMYFLTSNISSSTTTSNSNLIQPTASISN